jgi:triacylglycerol lipase
MGMFAYKNYAEPEAAQLVADAHRLSAFTNAHNFSGLPGATLLNLLGDITGNLFANETNVSIPEGWQELGPADLKLSPDAMDITGYYTFPSLYTGDLALGGPQAKVFAQYDEAGNVTKVNLNFCGTNNLIDTVDYLDLNRGRGAELYEPLLEVIKDFTQENGLAGNDVLISGFSLGGGLTNMMAEERHDLADGFFIESDYIGIEPPTIYNDADVVLNFGFENDAVYRITGNADSFVGALIDMDPGLINPDRDFASSMDNLVLFNDVYASPIWEVSPFSILNIPVGWYSHFNAITTTAIPRIIDSTFYEYTQKDSTVIVSELSALSRDTTWVRDKPTHTSDHYNTSAFLIGTKYSDLIAGGNNSDHIDSGHGNDTIKVGKGVDHVDGNEGIDEIRVAGRGKDWQVYQMQDDTLFFIDKDGNNLVEADNIESVSFQDELLSHHHNYLITGIGLVDQRPIMHWLNNGDKDFAEHVEGSAGNDALMGQVVFGRAGNDTLCGTTQQDVLHGGSGEDRLQGLAGNDRLFGAEGDDFLAGGRGNDQLIGGLGNDTFSIGERAGRDVIVDFNNDVGYQDIISFHGNLFVDNSDLAASTTQRGHDVLVTMGRWDSVVIENALVVDVLNNAVLG